MKEEELSDKKKKEEDLFYLSIEKLRAHFSLDRTVLNQLLEWGLNKYARIHNRDQEPTLREMIEIAAIYGLTAKDLLSPNLEMPSSSSLPEAIRNIAEERKGRVDKGYEKRNLISHIIIILANNFKVGDLFTNADIRTLLPDQLDEYYKMKSIEWRKSALKDYVIQTEQMKDGKTKPKILYKLAKAIPADMIKDAQRAIDQ